MSHEAVEVAPKEWTEQEAYNSGKGGYRIKVSLTGNPFKGGLADAWQKGWQDASLNDPYIRKVEHTERPTTRRTEYAEGEKRHDKSFGSRHRKSNGRPDGRNTRSRGFEDR